MGQIHIEGIQLYGYHGCLNEEGIIGGNYIVDIYIHTDFEQAALSDQLKETIDYVDVYNIVKAQVAVRSKLIEHVGQRILDEIKGSFAGIEKVQVKVTKLKPPMNGNVERVSVVLEG